MPRIIIAIDGHSSTGKSTVAKQLADYIGYVYVDSGAMYRAVTLYALRKGYIGGEHFNKKALLADLHNIKLEFQRNGLKNDIHLNGENVEKAIRTLEVSEFVSVIAAISDVRRKLVKLQHDLGKGGGVVMDGRDIGTVVFPKAELKLFMTASPEVRAQRRYKELLAREEHVSYEEVLANVMERDEIDSNREDSPLKVAEGAIIIDNSEMNLEDQFHIVLQLAKDRIAGRV